MKRDAFLQVRRLFDANSDGGSGSGDNGQRDAGKSSNSDKEVTWDTFYAGLDAATKTVVDDHTSGLKSALDKERTDRKGLEKQIKDLTGKAEKGSEMEASLAKLTADLEESNSRNAFLEGAVKNNVANPTLAYLAAKDAAAFDQSGNVNWERLRELHPQLFSAAEGKKEVKAGGQGDAGSGGAGGGASTKFDGNAFLAQAAGVTPANNE